MTDAALQAVVVSRLVDHPIPVAGVDALVLAAFEGPPSVDALLAGQAAPPPPTATVSAAHVDATYLESLVVEGFRGIGPAVTLDVAPGPGLTLVVGRNGSGKSSLAEALEMLLTGTNRRWADRAKAWGEGWRNLHHEPPRITATFRVEGRRTPLVVARTWATGAGVDGSVLTVDGRATSLESNGWSAALRSYPPLLSHNELGRILERPSDLYDALATILGLEEIATAEGVLRAARLRAEKVVKEQDAAATSFRERLADIEDERARSAATALKGKQWDVEAIESALTGGRAAADERSDLSRLRGLASLPVLDRERLRSVVDAVRAAQTEDARQVGSDADLARKTATLLRQALDAHSAADHERTCLVCGTEGVLTTEWRLAATQRIEQLAAEASGLDAAVAQARQARAAARSLLTPPPPVLAEAEGVGIDAHRALTTWTAWSDAPLDGDLQALAQHLMTTGPPLIDAVAELLAAAKAELDRRENLWRPVAVDLATWLPAARDAQVQRARLPQLKAAEAWMKEAHGGLREQRFAPIADEVQTYWRDLRQNSNVELGRLHLEGTAGSSQRRLALDISVDGEAGTALAVMSQGELSCLALSLFLPRASMRESPFRFLVVDDPVQAMDPVKVEGLARALERVAATRQVVVLTHDDRLPTAVRQLGVRGTIIEVARRERSVVELRTVLDPVQRYIEDALAVAQSDRLPAEATRVVPNFCRLALEAAAAEIVAKRLIRNGKSLAEVEAHLQRPTTLLMWLAAAMFDDAGRPGEVMNSLNKRYSWAADAVAMANRGSHNAVGAATIPLIRSAEQLARRLREDQL